MIELTAIHERCSGCRTCLVACALSRFREVNPAKAALRIEARFPEPGVYRVHLCDGCGACAEACPEEAIKEIDGVFRIDPDACTGCEVCVETCPEGVIGVHPRLETPIICARCGDCADACPRGAIVRADAPAERRAG